MSLKKATLYNCISKFGTMFIQFSLSLVLARLVLPSEYGVISIATILLSFFSVFFDAGLGISIIQHIELEKEQLNEIFSFTIVLGLCVALVMCVLSIPIVALYNNRIYYVLCPLFSISAFLNCINVVPNAILVRDKRFDLIAFRTILSSLIPGTVAVALAYLGAGVYSIVAQYIVSAFFLFVWNYSKCPLGIRKFRLATVSTILGKYSLFQLLYNVLIFFCRNADNLVIGACFGDEQLGFYDKAYTLSLYPNSIFTNLITSSLHPYVRGYKNDWKALCNKLISLLKVLSWAGILISTICFWASKEIILILFGFNWENSIPLFKVLATCIWAQMLFCVAGSVFLGIEKTNKTFLCGIINFTLLIIAVFIGILRRNTLVIAIGISFVYNCMFFITYFILVKKTMHLSFVGFIKHFVFDFAAMFVFFLVSLRIPIDMENNLTSICIKSSICLFYFAIWMLLSGQLFKVKDTIKDAFDM